MDTITVLVAAAAPARRRWLCGLLAAHGFRVGGSASTTEELLEVAARVQPQVVLVDVELPPEGGVDATRKLVAARGDGLKVVLNASSPDPATMLDAVRAGAVGYLTDDVTAARLGHVIRAVFRGEAALSRAMAAHLIHTVREHEVMATAAPCPPVRQGLTPRQLEILRLVAAGSTTADIAHMLYLSPETVRWHVKVILRKLGARTRAEAAAILPKLTA